MTLPLRIICGQKYGRLTVVKRGPDKMCGTTVRVRQTRWFCECECGTQVLVVGHKLRSGHTKSCGCLKRESSVADRLNVDNEHHGMNDTPEYRTWIGLKNRCLNRRDKAYKDYGGRGIQVCERWRKSFSAFYEDMGPRPRLYRKRSVFSIDRIDNNGNYEPGNCRWATHKTQNNNKRKQKRRNLPVG